MTMSISNRSEVSSTASEPDHTLRLIATLPAPDGLELRVKTALRNAPVRSAASLFEWPVGPRQGWVESAWMKGAAAAAIVFVVAGGGWGVYARVQSKAAIVVPHVGSGFSSAGAVRTPRTLDGPVLAHPQTNSSSLSRKKAAEAKKKGHAASNAAVAPAQR
jgi:hypothetical protein